MEHPLIQAQKLSYTFPSKSPVPALRNVSFTVQSGQILAIIGESGSGKSTLLRLLYGLLGPQSGEVRFEGSPLPHPESVLIPGHRSMRMVSQGFDDLDTYATVWDNVSAQLSNTDLPGKNRKTKKILASLRLTALQKTRIFDLSGGEKQRVAIARALVNEPRVLLLDEPFNQVDASFREVLQEDLLSIVEQTGLTVILVSHDPSEVLALANQLLILRKGRKVAFGDPVELFNHPPNSYSARLLAQANILRPAEAALLGIDSEQLVGIHRHQIHVSADPKGLFTVQAIRFRGSQQELLLSAGDLHLRVLQPTSAGPETQFKPGEKVAVQPTSYGTFRS